MHWFVFSMHLLSISSCDDLDVALPNDFVLYCVSMANNVLKAHIHKSLPIFSSDSSNITRLYLITRH